MSVNPDSACFAISHVVCVCVCFTLCVLDETKNLLSKHTEFGKFRFFLLRTRPHCLRSSWLIIIGHLVPQLGMRKELGSSACQAELVTAFVDASAQSPSTAASPTGRREPQLMTRCLVASASWNTFRPPGYSRKDSTQSVLSKPSQSLRSGFDCPHDASPLMRHAPQSDKLASQV